MIADDLKFYLQESREALLRPLDGLSDYDVRRPMTPTGTSLLGLVKHVAWVEVGYLGDCVGRPSPTPPPSEEDDGWDMWATAEDSRHDIVGWYREVWAHSDRSIAELPLDTPGFVPWWKPERQHTTFGHLLCRMVAETAQHAGHADIVREMIDGRGGRDKDRAGDAAFWEEYVGRVQAAADAHR